MYNIVRLQNYMRNMATNMVTKMKNETSGMGTIEMILLVAVLIALALAFNKFIIGFFGKLSSSIDQKKTMDSILGN